MVLDYSCYFRLSEDLAVLDIIGREVRPRPVPERLASVWASDLGPSTWSWMDVHALWSMNTIIQDRHRCFPADSAGFAGVWRWC